jgi:hypothetical protein
MQYAAQSREICGFEIFGLTYLRNLGIFDCELSPRIQKIKKNLHAHLCKFATVVNHTGSKVAASAP